MDVLLAAALVVLCLSAAALLLGLAMGAFW